MNIRNFCTIFENLKLIHGLFLKGALNMASTTNCVFCDKDFRKQKPTKCTTKKGKETLINASKRRRDGKDDLFTKSADLLFHEACRKSYIRESNIQ